MLSEIFKKYIAFIIVFFSLANFVSASFEITEVMYDPSGADTNREWVEVQNTGTSSDDLSKWYFFSDDTKHSIVPIGSTQVAQGAYAIIAQNPSKFKSDYPGYSGLLFDSSWTSLKNSGEAIALKDPNLNTVSSVSLQASSEGDSLQKIAGMWTNSNPTPAIENKKSTPVVKEESMSVIRTDAKSTTVSSPKKKTLSSNSYSPAHEISSEIIDLDALPASAGKSQISNNVLAYGGLSLVIIIGILSVFLLRRKNSEVGTLTADDMTIEE